MLTDECGHVINGKATYMDIAEKLKNGRPVAICWTEEHGSLENILFAPCPYNQVEPIKNTLAGYHHSLEVDKLLFVATDRGFFGFPIDNTVISESHIAEKLNLKESLLVTERLAILVNNVRLTLYNMLIDPQEFDFSIKS